MGWNIRLPKYTKEVFPEWFEETWLGHLNGAQRQYRYGRMHILEYEDYLDVHIDMVDPRSNPVGHVIRDAPEVIVGVACGALGGLYMGRKTYRHTNSKMASVVLGLAVGGVCFVAGMKATKWLGG
ncbi:MAG: hypothetical protein F4Y82_03620 [Cenarchaeum sp. SB0665_bin_23]|nr:hypothetical protein [Cenarchaeum sp. SB0667_bin_13]MXY37342.1 hypothetical protein [Cenarchaeum sp. SB0664_bin_35]MXY61189.1 hypothetical protein [Cenarchaeum sp. SB0665_bin_23]MXZ94098.1 hypothetical protein [Cenarchaeum sp. SB0666_bin_15]MYB46591.1 hypothetical protein [Cenarchaeum sp. SB0662_bin_33]MYC80189.1 hypothetical protein [Cenarchaeum sp. SB0661_bin_35]MYD58062.1 hypothetical protein [Cenarchaeum sp. SB0678_bin_8]MYG33664.1 hypothetical protein [Cenarchaeum sp. SB0677_bin_16]